MVISAWKTIDFNSFDEILRNGRNLLMRLNFEKTLIYQFISKRRCATRYLFDRHIVFKYYVGYFFSANKWDEYILSTAKS